MEKVNIQEAKTHLSRYAKKVKSGQTVILCERNIPIAEISPIEPNKPDLSPKQLILRDAKDPSSEVYHVETQATCLIEDAELMDRLKRERLKSGIPMEQLVKNAIQVGLSHLSSPPSAKPYKTHPQAMGLKKAYRYDNISELLAKADGEDYK